MKLTHSLGAKITAIFLLTLLTGIAFFGTSLTIAMINDGFYSEGAEAEQRFQEYQDTVNEYAWNADTAELKLPLYDPDPGVHRMALLRRTVPFSAVRGRAPGRPGGGYAEHAG